MRLTTWLRFLGVATVVALVPLLLHANEDTTVPKDRGLIVLKVPADAKVYFGGKPTKQTGSRRVFRTPVLTEDKDFSYEIKVVSGPAGKQKTRTETVNVRAGARQT